ncbi:hypothetical protein [Variovorax paradoxus]|uniref:hypothetical protein n=1 Tax=Variovorax paradoxus TaxID=34073 RepID=UPI003D649757
MSKPLYYPKGWRAGPQRMTGKFYHDERHATYVERNARALGPELIVNGSFSDGTGWTLSAGWSITGGQLVATAAAADSAAFPTVGVLTAGKSYEIRMACTSVSAGGWKLLLEGGLNVYGDITAAGTFVARVPANTSGAIYIWANSPLTATFDNVSVREIFG